MYRLWTLLVAAAVGTAGTAVAQEAQQDQAAQQEKKTEQELIQDLQSLLQANNIDEAEATFQQAIQQYPDSDLLKNLRATLYSYQTRAGNHLAAAEHLSAYIQDRIPMAAESPELASSLPSLVNVALSAYERAEKMDQGLAWLDQAIEQARGADAPAVVSALMGQKIVALASAGRQEEARKLIDEQLAAARKAVEASPDSPEAVAALAEAMSAEVELLTAVGSEQESEARQKLLDFLTEQAKKHSNDATVVSAYLQAHMEAVANLARTEPKQAQELIAKVNEFTGALETDDATIQSRIMSIEQAFQQMQRTIEAALVHANLIGQDAKPLDVEAWVNGEPLTDEDLKGKVVLLDFWAVWCGPCIATFPHLIEWQEKYGDDGLVILGMTRYYNYGWDADNNRPVQVPSISPEEERAAMEKFAEHHELEHRFAITPEGSTFQEAYGVTGIPQAVLIDQEGKIRLIRVGSGEGNAKDIEQLLVKLLGEAGAEAAGG
ncbi:MAG: redoxin family protein [Pirellulales bacterium]